MTGKVKKTIISVSESAKNSGRRVHGSIFSILPKDTHGLRASMPKSGLMESFCENHVAQLRERGFTRGLAKTIDENKNMCPLRIWIVDNSTSMKRIDGHTFVENGESKNLLLKPCSRWEELQDTLEYHARMAALLQAPTVFRLINKPRGRVGPQIFGVADKFETLTESDLKLALNTIRNASPSGVTPLCRYMYDIKDELAKIAPDLQAKGQRISIIIATDGVPTDEKYFGEFTSALKSLQKLPVPVMLTIRLCTDDKITVDYYNKLNSQLELYVDVLDNYIREAEKVHRYNKWVNYTLPLHRCREMGLCDTSLNLINERRLTRKELYNFCKILFGAENFTEASDPNYDAKAFLSVIKQMVKEEDKSWNPAKKKVTEIVDEERLVKIYRKSPCTIS
uniref:VWFA domain-containing protein n=1 Tax=Eucampia antarctica TaxID=49252 RepID=A0A7S2R6Z9_9STRA|mmetsp:Transcript_17353/g.16821  ORF Transcript_17353/g.16821 Transcript_17353/m.16821 type:complete len:395 (+) Transcript_17353:87-1271(+)|eukprot:CAMPEP_0197837030 /NCGR_PEP_ID=MMETSP1437-20131217/30870_1 /TAXON_ID=49252 ORGANISM="Eucampia antarctica, Strain CCMP1452" /NCGR_SAMPLE_ID=MMETSP1437 /ASSEMBLY_ACC=CAM_ASM_001096 /LENGTH=394 /DNA_ID=CAMNT_0043443713 /DNA_START=82 /DNA_END=1266 /DNA_ORIENTATION=+